MYFFFSSRRRHTRFDCDWSSDVCSSDLLRQRPLRSGFPGNIAPQRALAKMEALPEVAQWARIDVAAATGILASGRDRKSGVEGKSVDLGGRRIIKKKKKTTAPGHDHTTK